MILILQCFSHKPAEFAKFILEICRLIRYDKKIGENREKIVFVISRNKRKLLD